MMFVDLEYKLMKSPTQPTTALSSQLSSLRLSTPSLKLQPNQLPASLLFTPSTAKTQLDLDMCHSLAMMAFSRLSPSLPSSSSELLSH